MVALVFGQSNAANSGETPGRPHPGVFEFHRGRVLEARDPLLGAEGRGGSIWLRLGGQLVQNGDADAVVLVPYAFSSTEIERWAPGGNLHQGLLQRIIDAQRTGLRFTHLLWHQGEADARLGTSESEYRERFLAMLAAIRRTGVDAPVFVTRATRCEKTRESAAIRSAQAKLEDSAAGIRQGPDLDMQGFAERYDGCHFSSEGLDKVAQLWRKVLLDPPR
jgi:hypothetical protein